jgi:hypothetical protein
VHTAAGFEGDAGFDIWLTGPGTLTGYGTTAKMEEASVSTTEVMVWLNSPGIDRGGHDSLGYRTVEGRKWDVLYAWLAAAPVEVRRIRLVAPHVQGGDGHRPRHSPVES